MLKTIIICTLVFLNTITYAADLQSIIVAPSESVQPGDKVEIEVYFINPSDHPLKAEVESPFRCQLFSGENIFEVTLTPTSTGSLIGADIPGKGFIQRRYSFIVPESLTGPVGIELKDFPSKRALLLVKTSDHPPQKSAAVRKPDSDAFEAIHALFQPANPYIPEYEPTYFSVGTDPEKSKFQFSFKYKFFGSKGSWAKKNPWLKGFHFGYTQTSLWNLQAESKPFEDTSYKPELFYLTQNFDLGVPWISYFCVQAGFQHESNGKGGVDSRSTNYIYAKPILAFDLGSGYLLKVAPKVWVYANNDEDTNPDIEAYRGYFDLELKLGQVDGFVLGSNMRYGNKGGSIQADLTYPLYQAVKNIFFLDEDPGWINPNIYLHTQYYNGYAESLLNYNRKSHALRLGLAFVR